MFATLLAVVLVAAADKPAIECHVVKDAVGALAVVLDEAALAHTGQLSPPPKDRDDAGKQLAGLLDRLAKDLAGVKSDLDRVVKLNVSVAGDGDVPAVNKTLAERFKGTHRPAVCVSVGKQASANARVSLDAVAVAGVAPASVERSVSESGTVMGVLPAGPAYYVSGQAESGLTLARATRRTLESLRETLEHYKREDADVVQLRAFVDPMTKASDVRKEVEGFYGKDKTPPLVIQEWTAKDSVEIELIASAPVPKEKAKDAIDFLTPPKLQASAVFSRLTRINHGRRIYTSGIYATGKGGAAQVKDFFEQLKAVLKKTDSDVEHLAKATYFVADDDASKQLNTQRLRVYDPKRPPAASKAPVTTTGRKGCGLLGDFIAVRPR